MAKNKTMDIALENLDGFMKKGAREEVRQNIPTGHFELDFGLHYGFLPSNADFSNLEDYDPKVPLGLPCGRLVELYGEEGSGKSSLAYRTCGMAQKMGYNAAWIDTEHSFEDDLAELNGLDIDEIYYSKAYDEEDPDKIYYAEDIMDKVVALCRNAKKLNLKVVVLDSVANLVPKDVGMNSANNDTMALLARILSKTMGKVAQHAAIHDVLVVFINQVREKPGVMFGCLHADTLINFSDGRSLPIQEVVDKKIEGQVISYNEKTKQYEYKMITGWHKNGEVSDENDYISIDLRCPENGNGRVNITVTPDHEVMSEDGWVKAKDLQLGDLILSKQKSILNGTVKEFMSGVLCGDSHLCSTKNKMSAALFLQDNIDEKYAQWKVDKLNDFLQFNELNYGLKKYKSKYFSELKDFQKEYPNRSPMYLLDNFSWLGFAIWLMDDACYQRGRYTLSIKRFKGKCDFIDKISRKLDALGLYHYASYGGRIVFDKDVSDKISSAISAYVPPCMEHKLNEADRGLYVDFDLKNDREINLSKTYAEIVSIDSASQRKMKKKGKYDLSIADNHNYLAGGRNNGVLVHNSPHTTPGGRALKFNASVRLRMTKRSSKDELIWAEKEEGGELKKFIVGRNSGMAVDKNRCGPPLLDESGSNIIIDLPVYFQPYFPEIEEVAFNAGRQIKLVSVRTGTYTWKSSNKEIGDVKVDGRNAFIDYILKNELLYDFITEIKNKATEEQVILPPEIMKVDLESFKNKKSTAKNESKNQTDSLDDIFEDETIVKKKRTKKGAKRGRKKSSD